MADTLFTASSGPSRPVLCTTLHDDVKQREQQYKTYQLFKATHYKDKDNVAHEFMILEVYDGENVVALRAERRPSGRKTRNAWFTSSKSEAEDSISGVTEFNATEYASKYSRICSVQCPSQPIISLVDICDIFERIRHQSPDYKVRSQQCYWFCSMFLRRLQMLPGLSSLRPMKGPDYELGGKFMERWQVLKGSDIDKDIEEYLQQERQKEEIENKKEKEQIRASVFKAVRQHKSRDQKTKRQIRTTVTTHLKSADTIKKQEAQAVRDAMTKISADARGKQRGLFPGCESEFTESCRGSMG